MRSVFNLKYLLLACACFSVLYGAARLVELGLSTGEVYVAQVFESGSRAKQEVRVRKRARSGLASDPLMASCTFLDPVYRKTSHHEVNRVVREAAALYKVDENLLYAVMYAESRCNGDARSAKGALGLMQVMPETARQMGYHAHTTRGNILAGAKYLAALQSQYRGDMRLTLAAYNAGPGAVKQFGNSVPPFAETRAYVERVLGFYQTIKRQMA